MATKMIVTTIGGRRHEFKLDESVAEKPPEDLCKEFFDESDFSNVTRLHLGKVVFRFDQIESFEFE